MRQLRPLSQLESAEFGQGSYDVRNWKVRTRMDDREVGTVHDLLLDDDGRTRFVDVELDRGEHVLLPSGGTRVRPSRNEVIVPGFDREGLGRLPEYDHRPEGITPDYSRSLTRAYDDSYSDRHYYERSDYSAAWSRDRERGEEHAGERDESEREGKLAPVDELDDVEVADHDPDPRGWTVVGADREVVGEVRRIIGDTRTMKARYLTVALDDSIAGDGNQILVPVGHVELDADQERVIADALNRDRVASLPRFEGDTIDREYEKRLARFYDETYTGDRYYDHPRYRSRALNAREARFERITR